MGPLKRFKRNWTDSFWYCFVESCSWSRRGGPASEMVCRPARWACCRLVSQPAGWMASLLAGQLADRPARQPADRLQDRPASNLAGWRASMPTAANTLARQGSTLAGSPRRLASRLAGRLGSRQPDCLGCLGAAGGLCESIFLEGFSLQGISKQKKSFNNLKLETNLPDKQRIAT